MTLYSHCMDRDVIFGRMNPPTNMSAAFEKTGNSVWRQRTWTRMPYRETKTGSVTTLPCDVLLSCCHFGSGSRVKDKRKKAARPLLSPTQGFIREHVRGLARNPRSPASKFLV